MGQGRGTLHRRKGGMEALRDDVGPQTALAHDARDAAAAGSNDPNLAEV